MKTARQVRVAIDNNSKYWKSLSSNIFSNYYFQCSSADESLISEEGAKIVIEFVENDQNLLPLNEIGGDPYLRPFLYLYVTDVPQEGISERAKDDISMWIEKCIMTATTYLVIILQEEHKGFGPKNPVKATDFTSNPSELNNIIIVRHAKNKQLQNVYVDQIRNATRDHIVLDFNKYDQEAQERIESPSANQMTSKRFKVWRYLLLFSFGFIDSALNGFAESYQSLIVENSCTLNELLSQQIDANQITFHPFSQENNTTSILLFALHGVMAVSYNRLNHLAIVNFFFKHFAYIRRLCTTSEDHKKANDWGERAINTLFGLSQFVQKPEVASQLMFKKYLLAEERSADDIDAIYEALHNLVLKAKYSSAALDALYIQWESEQNRNLIKFTGAQTIGWNMVAKSSVIIFRDAISRGDYSYAFSTAKCLLSDKSQIENKEYLFQEIMNSEKSVTFLAPFRVHFTLNSDVFEHEIKAGTPFFISVKFRGPSWLPTEITRAKIVLKLQKKMKSEEFYSINNSTKGPLQFRVYLHSSGEWKFENFSLVYKELVLNWPLKTSLKVVVRRHENVPIVVDFPRIILPSKPLKMIIKMDFSNTMANHIDQRVSFEKNKVRIPEQRGKVILQNDNNSSNCHFIISADGKLTFITTNNKSDNNNNKSENNININSSNNNIPSTMMKFNPSLKILTVPITFIIDGEGGSCNSAMFTINSKIDNHRWQNSYLASFDFPLKVYARLMTEEAVHLVLYNSSDIPLTLKNNFIGERVISPDNRIFLLLTADDFERADEEEKNNKVADKNGNESSNIDVNNDLSDNNDVNENNDNNDVNENNDSNDDSDDSDDSNDDNDGKKENNDNKDCNDDNNEVNKENDDESNANNDEYMGNNNGRNDDANDVNNGIDERKDVRKFSVNVSDSLGENITRTWLLDDRIVYPRIEIRFDRRIEYMVGEIIKASAFIPKCRRYHFVPSKSFALVGLTDREDFEGGEVAYEIIPVRAGIIETPDIEIDGIVHVVHPRYIKATSHSGLSLGPFAEKQ